MYISFSDTKESALGGAAQGIIPVQDAEGNLMGGSAPASPEVREAREEAREVRHGVERLEEHHDKLVEAVERCTEQVAALAEAGSQQLQRDAVREGEGRGEGYFDGMGQLSEQLGRLNDFLVKNSEHVQDVARRQAESEEKLRSTLDDFGAKQKNDYLDMSQLSSHLDRIQSLMEQTASQRNDSAKDLAPQQQQPMQIDFSPLTDRLGKVQDAVEQNSALIKALLDEGTGADSKPSTPFWGKDTVVPQLQP